MKYNWLSYKFYSISIFLQFMFCALAWAQNINLVPDPSFEVLTGVNSGLATDDLVFWKNLDSTRKMAARAMCFNKNYLNGFTLPINVWCLQEPRNGNGVVVLSNSFYNPLSEFRRGLCRTKLKNKLIAGKTYCVKINAVSGERYSPYVTDGLQLYFDNGGLDTMISIHADSTGIYPQVVSQISLAQGQVLTDTVNWNLLMGSFIANGTEDFLTIGNFKSDTATTKVVINPSTLFDPIADLLIDDVSVYPIDLANWLTPSYTYAIGDSATIGLPNYETPDAKWYTYNMQLIDSGSQIKVLPPASGTKYICGIDMCNTMVFDTVTVVGVPLSNSQLLILNSELRVYPNPARDVIQVTHAFGDNMYLYNAVGTLVATEKIVQNYASLDVRHLAIGVYVLRTKTQVAKLVVE